MIQLKFSSPATVFEGEDRVVTLTVTNQSTLAGVPVEATFGIGISSMVDGTTLMQRISSEHFAPGETKTFDYTMVIPMGTGGQVGSIDAWIEDPTGLTIDSATEALVIEAVIVPATLYGQVTDAATGLPLPDVFIQDYGINVYTDQNGNYSIETKVFYHSLVFGKVGYDPVVKEVALIAGQPYELNISLTPTPIAEYKLAVLDAPAQVSAGQKFIVTVQLDIPGDAAYVNSWPVTHHFFCRLKNRKESGGVGGPTIRNVGGMILERELWAADWWYGEPLPPGMYNLETMLFKYWTEEYDGTYYSYAPRIWDWTPTGVVIEII